MFATKEHLNRLLSLVGATLPTRCLENGAGVQSVLPEHGFCGFALAGAGRRRDRAADQSLWQQSLRRLKRHRQPIVSCDRETDARRLSATRTGGNG